MALEIDGWINVLEYCSEDEIVAAWTEYQRSGPRSERGRLLKPDAGAIYQLVVKARERKAPRPQPPPDPPRNVVDAETAQRIIEQAGFTAERSALTKRFPSKPTMEAIEEPMSEPKQNIFRPAPSDAVAAARNANPIIQELRAAGLAPYPSEKSKTPVGEEDSP